jgi:Na+-transporting NADH:ubiquinone oxidoreductase subunit NqrE
MSTRAAPWLAWSLCGLSLVLTALSLFLFALNLSYSGAHGYDYWLQNAVQAVSFSIIGSIIASRLPANPVGWLFCAAACFIAVVNLSAEYAIYTLVARPDSLPAGEALAWLALWVWIPSIGCIVLSLLLFPNGRLPSSRWRWLAWLSVLLTIAGAVWVALSPGVIGNLGFSRNPLGIEGLPSGYTPVNTIMAALVLVAAVSTLGLRLLRTRGIERQQIKWPAYAAVVAAGGSLLYDTAISEAIGLRWLEWAGYVVVVAALVGFPISIGIAIVRYRLYDIDVIINRTLVYGSLTVTLIALYFGGIVMLQRIFVLLTGQQSTLAVVASTLLIAALFTPLRRRIQGFIDRRFYRRKYDARKTLEAFSTTLKNETDLEALNDDLVGVVRETMQPAHVSLWLRPDTAPKGGQTE